MCSKSATIEQSQEEDSTDMTFELLVPHSTEAQISMDTCILGIQLILKKKKNERDCRFCLITLTYEFKTAVNISSTSFPLYHIIM